MKQALFIALILGAQPIFAAGGGVKKVTDNVYSMFIHHYNSLVVIGNRGVLITDPANTGRAQLLKAEIRKLTRLPVTHIVLTHEHYDHVGGTEVFKHAKIYAQKNAAPILKLDVAGIAPRRIHREFNTRMTIRMGKTRVNLRYYGMGDGAAATILHLPAERLVVSSDMYEANQITDQRWIGASNHLGIRKILNKMVAFRPRYAITAHSADFDAAHLRTAAGFYNDLYAATAPEMLKAMRTSFPAVLKVLETLPGKVELKKYKNLKNYGHVASHARRMLFAIFHGG